MLWLLCCECCEMMDVVLLDHQWAMNLLKRLKGIVMNMIGRYQMVETRKMKIVTIMWRLRLHRDCCEMAIDQVNLLERRTLLKDHIRMTNKIRREQMSMLQMMLQIGKMLDQKRMKVVMTMEIQQERRQERMQYIVNPARGSHPHPYLNLDLLILMYQNLGIK